MQHVSLKVASSVIFTKLIAKTDRIIIYMQTEYDFKCRCVLAMYMRATFRCWTVGQS